MLIKRQINVDATPWDYFGVYQSRDCAGSNNTTSSGNDKARSGRSYRWMRPILEGSDCYSFLPGSEQGTRRRLLQPIIMPMTVFLEYHQTPKNRLAQNAETFFCSALSFVAGFII